MGFFNTIGQGISTFCKTVWKGLQAVWGLVKKVVSTLFSWAGSVLNWAANLAADIITGITVGVIVAFIWIFGDDDDLEDEDSDETELGNKINEKLGNSHKKVIIKGLWNKEQKKLVKETEIETTDRISSEVKQQTGGSRFAEIASED